MTAAQRRALMASHPDLGGSHEQAVKAIAKYKAVTDPRTQLPTLSQMVLSRLHDRPWLTVELVEHLGVSFSRVWSALSRLERERLAHGTKIRRRRSGSEGCYQMQWRAGAPPKRLTAGAA